MHSSHQHQAQTQSHHTLSGAPSRSNLTSRGADIPLGSSCHRSRMESSGASGPGNVQSCGPVVSVSAGSVVSTSGGNDAIGVNGTRTRSSQRHLRNHNQHQLHPGPMPLQPTGRRHHPSIDSFNSTRTTNGSSQHLSSGSRNVSLNLSHDISRAMGTASLPRLRTSLCSSGLRSSVDNNRRSQKRTIGRLELHDVRLDGNEEEEGEWDGDDEEESYGSCEEREEMSLNDDDDNCEGEEEYEGDDVEDEEEDKDGDIYEDYVDEIEATHPSTLEKSVRLLTPAMKLESGLRGGNNFPCPGSPRFRSSAYPDGLIRATGRVALSSGRTFVSIQTPASSSTGIIQNAASSVGVAATLTAATAVSATVAVSANSVSTVDMASPVYAYASIGSAPPSSSSSSPSSGNSSPSASPQIPGQLTGRPVETGLGVGSLKLEAMEAPTQSALDSKRLGPRCPNGTLGMHKPRQMELELSSGKKTDKLIYF
ncbi:unnamed protein product [Protopolystoma xenopodis]|uniref:Uncharacterized protein n=1 Tax=Protopolystoma xenopodis TaxID=117903 RepID=A0A448WLH3_9PLAT|nr:unnamed protein product [Protopolystoma xenopodis]